MKHLAHFLACLNLLSFALLSAAPLLQNGGPKNGPTPMSELPAYIKAAPDKVSLIADFDHKASGALALYLVNTTAADISLHSQDGDLGSKRETKAADGQWMRCDSHAYSWCGNSYGEQNLKPGHFLTWTQACDTQAGQASPLRFKLYGQGLDVASNEGVGVVDEADVQSCRYDALAMRHAPFEDVATVVTGKVQGGQGASISGRDDAIRALARFPADQRLFSVVKEVIAQLQADKTVEPERGGYEYTQCLAALRQAAETRLFREPLWDYVNGQVHDSSFPWRPQALEWLVRTFDWEKDKLRPVIEEVLATAAHPALATAAHAYPKLVEKSAAGLRLAALAKDPSRPENDRHLAQQAWEDLFPNPYVSIQAQAGQTFGNNVDMMPLKSVTIINASPQSVTLPFARPEALLLVEFVCAGQESKRVSINEEPGSLVLAPGQSVVIENVRWWDWLRGQKLDPAAEYRVHFLARTPGLWEVPAKDSQGTSRSGDKILKIFARTKPQTW